MLDRLYLTFRCAGRPGQTISLGKFYRVSPIESVIAGYHFFIKFLNKNFELKFKIFRYKDEIYLNLDEADRQVGACSLLVLRACACVKYFFFSVSRTRQILKCVL